MKPLKIIHVYKNRLHNRGYFVYIFIGDTPHNVMSILNRIKTLSLDDTFIQLSKNDLVVLEKRYGEYWYNYFFYNKHINYAKRQMKRNKVILKKLAKFGKKWVDEHIHKPIQTIVAPYHYSFKVEKDAQFKINQTGGSEFNTSNSNVILDDTSKRINMVIKMKSDIIPHELVSQNGGDDTDDTDNNDDIDEFYDDDDDDDDDDNNDDDDDGHIFRFDEKPDEKEVKEYTKELEKIIETNTKRTKSIDPAVIAFEDQIQSMDVNHVINKIYVTDNIIYMDDNIDTVKKKISNAIQLAPRFKDNHILPIHQYLWCNYYVRSNKKEYKLMIGHDWLRKNNLINFPVEPLQRIEKYTSLDTDSEAMGIKEKFSQSQDRIKKEDKNYFVLREYKNYIRMNEIHMMDICSCIGQDMEFTNEQENIIFNTLIALYYPFITKDHFNNIMNYLNGNELENEITYMHLNYETIRNDLLMDKEIVKIVHDNRKHVKEKNYKNVNIVLSVLRCYLKLNEYQSIDLWKIMNNFEMTEATPYVQLNLPMHLEGGPFHKFKKMESGNDHLHQKFVNWVQTTPVGLSIKVKITHNRYLALKINETGRIEVRSEWDEKSNMTMENISLIFPRVRAVIQKINRENKASFILPIPIDSDYEPVYTNTIQRFHLLNEKFYIDHNELSDFFRLFYVYFVVVRDPRKRKGKMENNSGKHGTYLRYRRVSNFESEGAVIQRITYYIRNYQISDNALVERISNEFNLTDSEAKKIIKKTIDGSNITKKKNLKSITQLPSKISMPGIRVTITGKDYTKGISIQIHGAKSNHHITEITNTIKSILHVYQDAYLIKNRKWKPLLKKLDKLDRQAMRRNKIVEFVNHDENIVSNIKAMRKKDKRLNHNSSKDLYSKQCQGERQPPPWKTLEQIKRLGYKEHKDGFYYRKIPFKRAPKKFIYTRALKFRESNMYYICTPEKNKQYLHPGVLMRSRAANGAYRPCCFKKDMMYSANIKKRNALNESIGLNAEQDYSSETNYSKYILRNSDKIQDKRLMFMPNILDILFNSSQNNECTIQNNNLVQTDQYYFMYGVKTPQLHFIAAISYCLEITINEIKQKLVKALQEKQSHILYTSLNEGNIRLQRSQKDFSSDIMNAIDMSFALFRDLVEKVFNVTIITFVNVNDDFYIGCNPNYGNNNKYIYLIQNDTLFYPIVLVTKTKKSHIDYKFLFNFNDNIHQQIELFYEKNCQQNLLNMNAFKLQHMLSLIDKPIAQIIDDTYKCTALVTRDNLMIPIKPSGCILGIPIDNDYTKYRQSLDKTLKLLKQYSWIEVNAIYLSNNTPVRVDVRYKDTTNIENFFLTFIQVTPKAYSSLKNYKVINIEDDKFANNIDIERNLSNNLRLFRQHMYHIYRYELHYFLKAYPRIKEQIIELQLDKKKKPLIQLLWKISGDDNIKIKAPKMSTMVTSTSTWIKNNKKDILEYKPRNTRKLCSQETEFYCRGNKMVLPKFLLKVYVPKIANDILHNTTSGLEVLGVGYAVSDIVNMQEFSQKDTHIIVKGKIVNIVDLLNKIFGKGKYENIKIKKKSSNKMEYIEDQEYRETLINKWIIQKIPIQAGNPLYRAIINTLYYRSYVTNLGAYSDKQNQYTFRLKGMALQWLRYNIFVKKIKPPIDITLEKLNDLFDTTNVSSLWLLELWAIHNMLHIPILIYNNHRHLERKIANGNINSKSNINTKDALCIQYYIINNLPVVHAMYIPIKK
uniref:Uncharacterized protein n=1 Tax=Megaviridae environmental sample TaxID=1737588 RepID=A0A5J6VJH3_9VIRU|nr:MAG: hypothetical protein [Megaviridae environmental sample]